MLGLLPLLLVPALAGVEVDLDGWPVDVSPPSPRDCPVPPWSEGWEPVVREVTGEVDAEGRFHPDTTGPSTEAVRNCTFTPARFEGGPAVVPVVLRVTHPAPHVELVVTLRELGRGTPIAGSRLALGEQVVLTDAEGKAAFRRVGGGILRSLDPGLELADHPAQTGELELWGARREGWELVARYSAATDRAGTSVITREEVALAPGVIDDPVRAVSTRPGVVRTPFESGWIIVRGGDPGDDDVAYDGVRIPLLFHLGGFASLIPDGMVEEVRFWPGGAPARYGRTLSGVVDVIPPRAAEEASLSVGANVVYAHGTLTAPTPVGTLQLGLRRSYLDAVMTAVLDEQQARIAPRFWDVHARLAGRRNSLTFLALDDSINAPTGVDDTLIVIRQRAGQLQGRFDVDVGSARLRITPWLSRWRRSIDGSGEEQATDELFPGARVELSRDGRIGWAGGLEAEVRRYRIEQGSSVRDAWGGTLDPYADVRVRPGPFQLDVGIRLDSLLVQDQLLRTALTPRILAAWSPSERVRVHAALGRSSRPPDPVFLVGLADGAYLGLERSDNAELGVELGHGIASVALTGWTRRLEGLAGLEDDGSLGELSGRAHGFESELVLATERAVLRALYQYTRTVRQENAGEAHPTPWDQPHRVQLIGYLQLPRRWSLSSRFRYSSAFPSPRQATDAYDLLTGRVTALEADGGRLQPYVSTDLKVSRTFLFERWSLDAYLDLQNVTSTRIFEPIISGIDDRLPAFSKGLPFLPVLGVEGNVLLRPKHSAAD